MRNGIGVRRARVVRADATQMAMSLLASGWTAESCMRSAFPSCSLFRIRPFPPVFPGLIGTVRILDSFRH
jgi:hypothetical protein